MLELKFENFLYQSKVRLEFCLYGGIGFSLRRRFACRQGKLWFRKISYGLLTREGSRKRIFFWLQEFGKDGNKTLSVGVYGRSKQKEVCRCQ